MYAIAQTFTMLAALVGQFDAAPSCNGPNCGHDASPSYGADMPYYDGPRSDADRWSDFSRPNQMVSCRCQSCDPGFPCSSANCQAQNCSDCGSGCRTCPPNRLQSRGPARGQPSFNVPDARLLPRPEVRVQKLCPVTGEALGSMGEPIPVAVRGRTVYVCCKACVKPLLRDPEQYLDQLNSALSEGNNAPPIQVSPPDSIPRPQLSVQKLCPVTGEELGSMGPPISVTMRGRTFSVCCEACVSAVRRNPEKYLQKLDEELNSGSAVFRPSPSEYSGTVVR